MNGGDYTVRRELHRKPSCGSVARYDPEDSEMRKQLIVIRCFVRVDLAACLRAVAVAIYLLT